MKRIRSKKIITPHGVYDGYVYFEGERILEVTNKDLPVTETIDATDLYVCPGFIDIHTHGGGGYRFEGSTDEIIAAASFHLKHGTTAICPTVSADAFDVMSGAVKNIAAAMSDERVLGTIIGAHLEGPYLSPKQAGAQCPAFITPPNEAEYLPLLEEYSPYTARWTYAPENDEGERFVKALLRYGVKPSLGHTDAVYDDVLRAYECGCDLVTHLYSCTSTVTREQGFRRLGVIESAYLIDGMYAEIICDGRHLPPELIRLIYKIKGAKRIALITDSLALAGTDMTHGFMQNTEFIIEDGVCKLMDRSAFAGSIATADRLLRVAANEAGIPLLDAVRMLTETPAEIMGLTQKGRIAPGMDADLVLLDESLRLTAVIAKGKSVDL